MQLVTDHFSGYIFMGRSCIFTCKAWEGLARCHASVDARRMARSTAPVSPCGTKI